MIRFLYKNIDTVMKIYEELKKRNEGNTEGQGIKKKKIRFAKKK